VLFHNASPHDAATAGAHFWLATDMKTDFKGNKQGLPSKPCAVCGRPMSWRKAWAKNWAEVLYCSDACRAKKRLGLAVHG
jgi:hypothetical protein